MTSGKREGTTEVKPEVVFLGKLLERVIEGKMLVPKFQRPFVWRQDDLLALLESVLKGYPIGSLLIWETDDPVSPLESIGPIPVSRSSDAQVGYILDGHQRIATLVGTLLYEEKYANLQHGVNWKVFCDLETMEFMVEPREGLGPQHFPVRKLLSTSTFMEACRRIHEACQEDARNGAGGGEAEEEHHRAEAAKRREERLVQAADLRANAFRNYKLPLISVAEGDLDTAVAVFARLNRKGRKMSPDEMVSALTYREDEFHLAGRLDELQRELAHQGYGRLDRIFPLRAVLAAMDRDIYAKDFADLLVKPSLREKLPESVDIAEQAIQRAIDCLHSWGVTSDRLLPYGLQLVFLADFLRICPKPSAEVAEALERWFWVTSFTGWFGGVNSTQARLALAEMRELAKGKLGRFQVMNLDEPGRPFPERFDTRSARVRAFLLYLASLRPRSLIDDGELDPGALHAELGSQALAYVVARLPKDLQSSPANRMYVDRGLRTHAIRPLRDLDEQRIDEVLPTHGFPEGAVALIQNDDRVELIRARLRHLIAGERQFMTEHGVALPTTESGEVIADSDVSDDE